MSFQDSKKQIVKFAGGISVITFISRILGLIREQVRAFYLGTGIGSDAFGIAFMIPNLFRRLVGEGAMTAAFIPVFTDYLKTKDRKAIWNFVNSFLTILTFALTIFVILFILGAPMFVKHFFARGYILVPGKMELTIRLTQIMFVYIFFISLAALASAILNSFNKFNLAATTPIILNIAIISAAYFLSDNFPDPSYGFAIGVICGGVLQLLVQIPAILKLGMKFKPRINLSHPGVRKVLLLMGPGVFGVGIYQINVAVSEAIATMLAPGSVASLQYSSRLLELTLGVFVISISVVILPLLARQASANKIEDMKETLLYSLRLIFFITIPATVGLIILRTDIIAGLFMYGEFDAISLSMTSYAVFFHALGLLFIGAMRVLVPVFYSLKDTKTPVKISFVVMIINIALCFILSPWLENGGIAFANTISALVNSILLLILLWKKIGQIDLKRVLPSFLKVLCASVVMGVVCYVLSSLIDISVFKGIIVRISIVLAMVVTGAATYVFMAWILKSRELNELWGAFRK